MNLKKYSSKSITRNIINHSISYTSLSNRVSLYDYHFNYNIYDKSKDGKYTSFHDMKSGYQYMKIKYKTDSIAISYMRTSTIKTKSSRYNHYLPLLYISHNKEEYCHDHYRK